MGATRLTVRLAGLLLVPAIYLAATSTFPLPHRPLISAEVDNVSVAPLGSLHANSTVQPRMPWATAALPAPKPPSSTEITIHMTGLLLLTPATQARTLPLHVLVPTEGNLPQHVVELAWASTNCQPPAVPKNGICTFNMDGWAIELGQNGRPKTPILPPPGPIEATKAHRIPRTWFGPTPVADTIRARLTLHSGRATIGCSISTSWNVDGVLTSLPNVINWVDTIPGTGFTLTATSRAHPQPFVVQTFTTNRVDLSLRYEPKVPTGIGKPPYIASHLNRWYDLLRYSSGEHRIIPQTDSLLPTCPWMQFLPDHGPGTPTCMPAGGLPNP